MAVKTNPFDGLGQKFKFKQIIKKIMGRGGIQQVSAKRKSCGLTPSIFTTVFVSFLRGGCETPNIKI